VKRPLEPAFSKLIPPGEDRERAVCDHCGFIDYVNPRIVVGAVAAWSDQGAPFGRDAAPLDQIRILLCRRAIMPRRGWWTLPAGFMETGETMAEGALREAREEAGADLELDGVLALYDIPVRSQVQVIHRARLRAPEVEAGVESLEVRLFAWEELPWKELAFHTVSWGADGLRGEPHARAVRALRQSARRGGLAHAGGSLEPIHQPRRPRGAQRTRGPSSSRIDAAIQRRPASSKIRCWVLGSPGSRPPLRE
jgi:ADP-ribose pyrophosphatase YjhB (NUDIX family)